MFPSATTIFDVGNGRYWVADIPITEVAIFSGTQFFIALIAGVLMAFAFQLLLTNFSVAFGISALGGSSNSDESESLGGTIRKIETAVGLWTLITVSIALFIACFLAVKLSLVSSTVLGAITGIVIWSTYFSLLVWVGSTAVGSLIGSVVSTATSGFQGLMGTAAAAIGANAASSQVVSTAEAVTAAVRRELTSGIDPNSIRDTLQSSLANVQLPKLDVEEIGKQFEKILNSSDLRSLAGSEGLNVDRQTLVDLVSSRTDFSRADINKVVDQLEGAWKNVVGQQQNPQAQIQNFLQSATPEELRSGDLGAQLQKLVASNQGNGQKNGGVINQAMQLGASTLLGTVLKRTDLSDLDVEKISGQLQQLAGKATEQASKIGVSVAEKAPALPFNTIKADVDDYLQNSYAWHLNRETIKNEFKDVIYDPEADPATVRRQLEQINLEYFTQKLSDRGDLLPAKVQEVAEQLESIRNEVLDSLQYAPQGESKDIRASVEDYLSKTGKAELNPEGIKQNFQKLLEDPQAGFEALRERLSQFDRNTLVQLLNQRQDISNEEAEGIVSQLESSRDSVLNRANELQEQAKARASELRTKVEEYLRNTNKEELNPEGIKRDFQTLFEDPQAGISVLRERLSQFDRDTLVQLLRQRQDLSEEQINQTLDQIESVRSNILQAPQKLVGKAQEQYEQTTTKIAEYLRNTNLEELDPEGIKRDLTKLLDDPKEGALALRERLSQVDRETLVKLLSQRQDLSEEQVNKAIDQIQASITSIVKAPRRLASRATKQVVDFESNLESYLRNTNKEELNPDSIKRDLQLLLNDPRSGLGSISDRLSKFDRSTLVALLSQREDISEEEANQIADRVESVRNSIVEQAQKIQQTVQSAIDGVFGKIRNYLNSLERPELNYEGITQDFSKLFDDPQAGFTALRDRISSFDRDTLVAVLSSREDISEADANRIIAQIEGTRDKVLHQAERIQTETQKRLEALKQQTQKQAAETKKAAAGAAWWLFSTALTSLVASAIAGILAVRTAFSFFI
ncbi:hypothetical protein [Aliterella atlantica]|uniref:Uncharacterized protein n=1 Tax=Aliterella atlantica CENA595 TaxID=1618023 RepID=A0A0D8ZUN3_9CYAN|nr:hypothetical protein [Aliterella atlantica]KJH72483.1 hypothetical protein UH38_06905 [Aliterella atlantica CENA595]